MAKKHAQRSVGRPREFDEEVVLEAAMEAFWRKGYEATSLADLCLCTGLNKGSLYRTYGDKHRLFMRALTHYADKEFHEVMSVAFKSESPLENIRAVVRKISEIAGKGRGCMMINSLVELAPHDPEVKAALQSFGKKRMRVMTDMIDKAQRAGELRVGLDPNKLARQLMLILAGAAAMAKGFLPNREIDEVLEELIGSWS